MVVMMGRHRNLTRAQTRAIRRKYWTQRTYMKDLAREYGCSVSWIAAIVHDVAYVDEYPYGKTK